MDEIEGKAEEWKHLSEEAIEIMRTKDRGTLQLVAGASATGAP